MDCTSRILGPTLAVAAVLSMTLPAAGFFDFFGTQPFQPQPQPYYYGQSPQYGGGWGRPHHHYAPRRPHHAKAPVDEKIARQTPTDLMHDATLRYGDAVMTKSGISIFTGTRKASHDRSDFSPLQDVRMKPSQKIALDAIDPTHPDRVRGIKPSDELKSGRSSASTMPLAEGVMIDGGNGKSIRYVGP